MPYRIDIDDAPADALDRLVQLGALDVELVNGGLAAILLDAVAPETVARTLGVNDVRVSPAMARDHHSVWLLSPRAALVRGLRVVPSDFAASPDALRLKDSPAFGTGHHPTTALCMEALAEILAVERLPGVLDVGTGSGILALAALKIGVAHAVGLDIDPDALQAAAENARLNGLNDRLQLVHGGPEAVQGVWPLVVANVLAAPLMEMAPVLVRRLSHQGWLILSGIPNSVELEVRKVYEHLGMRHASTRERDGWVMLMARASW